VFDSRSLANEYVRRRKPDSNNRLKIATFFVLEIVGHRGNATWHGSAEIVKLRCRANRREPRFNHRRIRSQELLFSNPTGGMGAFSAGSRLRFFSAPHPFPEVVQIGIVDGFGFESFVKTDGFVQVVRRGFDSA